MASPSQNGPQMRLGYVSDSDEEACDAPLDSMQTEWWQEDVDGVVLGIKQQSDNVQGCDHFTWFRIPLF